MDVNTFRIKHSGRCKRCGKQSSLCSNGYCSRCDNVLYGKKSLVAFAVILCIPQIKEGYDIMKCYKCGKETSYLVSGLVCIECYEG